MALDPSSGYVAASTLQDLNENSLPIFSVERVSLQFSTASDFAAAQVANNILILALTNGRILRIDLDAAEDIDGTTFLEAILNTPSLILLQILTSQKRLLK
jgi:vacuolar protein sorting-associated protein 18